MAWILKNVINNLSVTLVAKSEMQKKALARKNN